MNQNTLVKLNQLISGAYECASFSDFLKLAIVKLHEVVMYDSGMFFCAISRDCSFFKPYLSGDIEAYYHRRPFLQREEYLAAGDSLGTEAYVFKTSGGAASVDIDGDPRAPFLRGQDNFHVACIRIVYKGRFLGEIYLHRDKKKPDFSEDDLFLLRLMQPHVSGVFHMIHDRAAAKAVEDAGGRHDNIGICAFDGDLSLMGGNVTGIDALKAATVFGSSVLYSLKELCEDFEQGTKRPSSAMRTETIKTQNGEIRADIFRYPDSRVSRGIKYVAVLRFGESPLPAEYKFKFTKREADIIDGLIQGKNKRPVGQRPQPLRQYGQNPHQEHLRQNRSGQPDGAHLHPHAEQITRYTMTPAATSSRRIQNKFEGGRQNAVQNFR